MTLHVKYALMTSGRPTDREFEAPDQQAAEAEIAKDLATGCTIVHGSVTDQDTKQVIALHGSGDDRFRAVEGVTGWTERA